MSVNRSPNPDAGLTPTKGAGGRSDWLPSSFRNIQDASYYGAEDAAAHLIDHTNAAFKDLGISVDRRKVGDTAVPNQTCVCAGCKKPIQGRVLQAMNNNYHPDCFQCSQCARPFDSPAYVVRKNASTGADEPWCKKCIEWAQKERPASPMSAAAAPSPTPVKLTSQVVATSAPPAAPVFSGPPRPAASQESKFAAHDNIQQGKSYCSKCNQPIMGLGVDWRGSAFHQECFTCAACGIVVHQTDGFVRVANAPWHQDCYQNSTAPRCGTCKGPIVGKFVVVDNIKHHKECFVCASCAGPLTGGYLVRGGQPLCTNCTAPNAGGATTLPGSQIAGMRFNQVTGQVTRVTDSSARGYTGPALGPQPVPANYVPPPSSGSGAAAASGGAKRFCIDCGKPATATAKFCGNCGKLVQVQS